jgi:hypothetical protein
MGILIFIGIILLVIGLVHVAKVDNFEDDQ